MRDGSITNSQIDNLNDSLVDNFEMDEGKIILTTTNARASGINQNYLKQLSSEEFSYRAQATDNFTKNFSQRMKCSNSKRSSSDHDQK